MLEELKKAEKEGFGQGQHNRGLCYGVTCFLCRRNDNCRLSEFRT